MATFTKYTSGFNVSGTEIGIQPVKITSAVNDERVLSGTEKIGDEGVESKLATSEQIVSYVTGRDATLTAQKAQALTGDITVTFEGGATGEVSFASGGQSVTAELTVPYSAISAYGEASVVPSADSTKGGLVQASAIEKALAALETEIGQIGAFDGPYATTAAIPKVEGKYDTHKIFLVGPVTGVEGADKYEEYISSDGDNLTMIGDTTLDLTPYVRIENISAASANWDETSAYVAGASANLETASGYAAAWNEFSTAADTVPSGLAALKSSAVSGAEASAWIAENGDELLKEVTTSGYVSGNGTEDSAISLTDVASNAIDAVTGAITVSADIADTANSGKLAQAGAISAYVDSKISETIAETIDIASAIDVDTPTSAIPNVGAITAYDQKNVTSAFGQVIVTTTTGDTGVTTQYDASAKKDVIKFIGGKDIALSPAADANGNPTITINSTYETPEDKQISGYNGISAELTEDGVYHVSGIDATTAAAGVTKAAYYNDTDGLIYLF